MDSATKRKLIAASMIGNVIEWYEAEGINNAGLIVGNYQSDVGGLISNHVFLYSSGSYTTKDVPLSDTFTGGIPASEQDMPTLKKARR
jgi:hypothetical protein